MSWHNESRRHALASKGIKTKTQPVTRVVDLMDKSRIITGSELTKLKSIMDTTQRIVDGDIPEGRIDIIHYYILEDNNQHELVNKLTKEGKFGAFETHKYPDKNVYVPKAYEGEEGFARFKEYRKQVGVGEDYY